VLGLGLADELEQLRPFGMGNPQPTLLVPAARFQHVTGMGEENEHARFTLVTAGGARSRGVAFRSPPRELAPAQAENHDIALRLERNRWNGMVEPRVILRALCPTRAGELRVLDDETPFWERLRRALEPAERVARGASGRAQAPGSARRAAMSSPVDRRGEGFAGVAGDLLTSGERVLVAVAHVERRREGLERIVAGVAPGGMPVVSWGALGAAPELAAGFDHLIALDPPPRGVADPLLAVGPRAHLAWGSAEAEFAEQVHRAELYMRPALSDVYRALRELPADALERALRGDGRYPRTPECCARLVRVLSELELIELSLDPPRAGLLDARPTELERSPTFRAAMAELDAPAPARAA
jgi:hypothetical protein